MCSLRRVFALGSDSQVTSANVSGWSWQRIPCGITFGFILFSRLNLLFYHVQCALRGSYKHREVSYLLITVFTQERLGAAFVCLGFFAHFVLLCFCNYTNTCLWGGSLHGDSEDHQPATSMALSKAAGWEMHAAKLMTGILKLAYTCSLLSGWKMNCQLLSTCSDTTLHMVEACSACILLGPQLGIHQVWKRGVLARRRRGKRSLSDLIPFSLLVQAVGKRSMPLTFVSPAEPLSKMKWSKPGASA